jgi:hypothetical protein
VVNPEVEVEVADTAFDRAVSTAKRQAVDLAPLDVSASMDATQRQVIT